ncbi:hypothetical protein FJM67_05280 [Maribrevibacterium harenarium]|uniref:Uncharacterized protein n=1 Tax=Maribrevibacterium harenarium TaxID=2589817 RepID=A0A501X1K5_9GAMM|nr:hypothetical protein [Maribrevibacterium harenarium]TPE54358.1 hypothetical protein FJM67_05280 [Maribrevibacterium harenarium]
MLRLTLLITLILTLSGCATYRQDIDEGLQLAKNGDWQGAETVIDKALESPQDTLLRYLEKGALAQYQGDYERSNELLEQAEQLSDTFFKKSLENRAWALLSNPRQSDYYGNGVERVYISYLKSLNYLALAEEAPARTPQRQSLLDAAVVEARRIDLKLNEISALTTSYAELDAKENQAFYMKALDWLGNFYAGGRSSEEFQYREDAWGRYLEGLQYESAGDYDDARISYTNAAKLYESGYAKQYDLSPMTAQRARLDAIRMMQKSGWSQGEVDAAINQYLDSAHQELLSQYQQHDTELVIIEHQGFIPDKAEMSLFLYADPEAYSLVLDPVIPYENGRRNLNDYDEFRWFTMVYSDANPLSMFANYKAGGIWRTFDGLFTKRVILGAGVWRQLRSLGLEEQLLQVPLRITVPFYRRFELDNQPGILSLGADTMQTPTLRMSSLADIALQDQIAHAQRDIYEGLVRELLRAWLAQQARQQLVKDNTLGMLVGFASQVALMATSAADTRNWLTLPAQVRLQRRPLAAGTYTPNYQVGEHSFTMEQTQIASGEMKIWNIRNPY